MMSVPTVSPMLRQRALVAALLAAALAALGGCTVYAPAQPVYASDTVYVPTPPPAPIQETITIQPSGGMVWLPGFWAWGGTRYVWRAGHWSHPPAGYGRWAPGHWQHTPRGHVWRQGGWRR